jgi:membrane protease YdiL (CAAX protease family)
MRQAIAFLLVWLPYVSSTWLAERAAEPGVSQQLLMLLSFAMIWPAAFIARSGLGLDINRRVLFLGIGALVLGVVLQLPRWFLGEGLGIVDLGNGASLAFSSLPLLLLTTFIPSLTEDVLTRGFPLFAWASRRWPSGILILFSAALYVLNHLWRFDWGWTEQVRLFAMGIAYAAAAWRFRSLWAAIGLHWGGNLAVGLFGGWFSVTVVDVDMDRLLFALANVLLAVAIMALPTRRRT